MSTQSHCSAVRKTGVLCSSKANVRSQNIPLCGIHLKYKGDTMRCQWLALKSAYYKDREPCKTIISSGESLCAEHLIKNNSVTKFSESDTIITRVERIGKHVKYPLSYEIGHSMYSVDGDGEIIGTILVEFGNKYIIVGSISKPYHGSPVVFFNDYANYNLADIKVGESLGTLHDEVVKPWQPEYDDDLNLTIASINCNNNIYMEYTSDISDYFELESCVYAK